MKLSVLIAAALAAAAALPVIAQVVPPVNDPGALQQRRIDEEERRRQIERLERKPVTDPVRREGLEAPVAKPGPGTTRFLVRGIRFTASEIFSAEDLATFARDYTGKELTLADLQLLVNRINAAYRDRRVVSAQAVLPPQDISGGVVEIRLIEGRLGSISLTGNDTTKESYITNRIGLKPDKLVDLPGLEQDLQRFNRTNDAQLRAELKPGTKFGTTDLQLAVTEPPRHDLRAFIDNSGVKATGEWRAGLIYTNRSLLGYRDDLSLSATRAVGQESYSLGYGFPFNTYGGRLSLAYYKDYTQIRYGPLAPLDLTGESTAGVISLRQPVYFGEQSQIDLLGGLKSRRSENWVSNVFLQRTDTEDASIGAEAQLVDAKGFWLATYNFVSGRSYTVDRDNFSLSHASLRRNHNLDNQWSVRGNMTVQHTNDRLLPASQQMFIGGEGSVRGYPIGSFAGDRGYQLSLELHHPMTSMLGGIDPATASATGFFFTDYGYVKPARPPGTLLRDYEQLSSIGWGINLAFGKRINARTTFAYALNDLPLEPRRYVVHFTLAASLF